MEGYEQIQAGAVEVAVQHDPGDNEAMVSLSSQDDGTTAARRSSGEFRAAARFTH